MAGRNILISGSGGFIGRALVSFFAARGDRITVLVRPQSGPAGFDSVEWDPDKGRIDRAALEGFDTVVHLGGFNIASCRWTRKNRKRFYESRVASTRLLAQTFSQLKSPPQTFICASATGFYGNRSDELLTEVSLPGKGFLSSLCQDWEAAAEEAGAAGCRVVSLRFGPVLGLDGGILARLIPLFRAGLGAQLGSGGQFMSWIALPDVCRAVAFLLDHDSVAGPVNLVAPEPVTNAEFTRQLADALHRRVRLKIPAGLLRLLCGRLMADELLLASQQIEPAKLAGGGFEFHCPQFPVMLKTCIPPGS